MKTLSTLALVAALSNGIAQAQTRDIVVFSDDGAKFTLIIDGDVKNEAPAARVVATGIRNETPLCVARFEDKALGEVKQNTWFEAGKEYTMVITTNKKGVKVFRMQGQAEQGTAAAAQPSERTRPTEFRDDSQPASATSNTTTNTTGVKQDVNVGGVQTTTTTTVTEETDGMNENVNMSIGINGVGINMNVGVTDNMGGTGTTTTTTSHTTTTTTSSSSSSNAAIARPVEKEEPAAYSMPGYSGKVGCPWPMNTSEFNELKNSIGSKNFEDSKMTLAKQVAGDRCMTVDQVKGIMGLFSFEDSKLDFAKFAYDHTYDISNYYKVNDAFTFESSIEELNEYIQGR